MTKRMIRLRNEILDLFKHEKSDFDLLPKFLQYVIKGEVVLYLCGSFVAVKVERDRLFFKYPKVFDNAKVNTTKFRVDFPSGGILLFHSGRAINETSLIGYKVKHIENAQYLSKRLISYFKYTTP